MLMNSLTLVNQLDKGEDMNKVIKNFELNFPAINENVIERNLCTIIEKTLASVSENPEKLGYFIEEYYKDHHHYITNLKRV